MLVTVLAAVAKMAATATSSRPSQGWGCGGSNARCRLREGDKPHPTPTQIRPIGEIEQPGTRVDEPGSVVQSIKARTETAPSGPAAERRTATGTDSFVELLRRPPKTRGGTTAALGADAPSQIVPKPDGRTNCQHDGALGAGWEHVGSASRLAPRDHNAFDLGTTTNRPRLARDDTQALGLESEQQATGEARDELLDTVEDGGVPYASDPLLRQLACPAMPAVASGLHVASSRIDQIALQLVKRVAAGGNGKTGLVRLQLGEGESSCIEVSSDGDAVAVKLSGRFEQEDAELAARIRERLQRRGLNVSDVSYE